MGAVTPEEPVRGVRPSHVPDDFVEVDCTNPTCLRSTWIPPNAMEAAREGGSIPMPVCSAECAAMLADVAAERGASFAVVDPQERLLGHTIDEMYVFVARDADGEGIPAITLGNTAFPLVAADWGRVEALRKHAERLAKISGKKIKLVKFSVREDIEEIG